MSRSLINCDIFPIFPVSCTKVAPDYEAAELGVGDSIIIKALCENFGRRIGCPFDKSTKHV